jgi:hypothetical protein
MLLITWCRFTIEKLVKFQTEKSEKNSSRRQKRQFRSDSILSLHRMKVIWSKSIDLIVSVAILALSWLQLLIENHTPYEKTAFQKVSEYIASPRLLICFIIPLGLLPLLLFLVRVGLRIFEDIVYQCVYVIRVSNTSWTRSNHELSMLDFFDDASETSVYTGGSIRQIPSDSILYRILLNFSQILLSRDVELLRDFLSQLTASTNICSILCIFATILGFFRFFTVYRGYIHALRERGRRVLIDSKIDFAMHKSSSLVPGQFWSTTFGFFAAFLVFMVVSMIARWQPLKKFLSTSVIEPLVVALFLHCIAVGISRISDNLLVPNLMNNSLWMPRRRLFSLYELFMTLFGWISAAGSMIFRFIASAACWLCLAPMDFFQQKSLSFKFTDRDVVGSERFIAAIGVDHVIDSPLTSAIARILIQNIDNFTARSSFDKSRCDPMAIHMELQQYTSRDQRRFLMSRWQFLSNMSTGTKAAADIKALRKPFVGVTYKKLPITGFGSTQNFWNIVKMDPGIREWLRLREEILERQ